MLKSQNSYSLEVIPENLKDNDPESKVRKNSVYLFPSDVIKSKRDN